MNEYLAASGLTDESPHQQQLGTMFRQLQRTNADLVSPKKNEHTSKSFMEKFVVSESTCFFFLPRRCASSRPVRP